MNQDELIAGIEAKLRGLRSCDTQATAVAWMASAYKLMEECLLHLKDKPPEVMREQLVIMPERPRLQIVQQLPSRVIANRAAWPGPTPTVVYPEVTLHPGLKPLPKPWTRADTLRLERSAQRPRVHGRR